MGKRLNSDEMQTIFEILQKSYDVYGPKIYQGTGCFSDTDIVRYGLLNSWEELVWDQKSDYSFKEVLFPVSETILYFTEDEMKTADGVARQRLIFLKSCDFHALKRLDEMYLKNEGIKMNTISFYMRVMRAVYNRAVNDGLATEKQPFRNVYTGIDKTEKRAIPLQTIKAIKELYMPSRALHFARDMFLFSFYTRGMSFIDMAYLKKTDLSNGILTYKRRKTKQQLSIKWEKCMQEIVNKWPSYNDYLLPIITIPGKEERMQYKSCQKNVNMQLDKISKMLKMRKGITMYVARHSWASIAKNMNIPIGVISDSMGHTSLKTTQIYLSAIDMDVINKANLKILNKIEKRNEETKAIFANRKIKVS